MWKDHSPDGSTHNGAHGADLMWLSTLTSCCPSDHEHTLAQAGAAAAAGTDLLRLVGVQVQDLVMLAAHEVEGGARSPSHNTNALRPCQHLLQLRYIPLIYLQQSCPSVHLQVGLFMWTSTYTEAARSALLLLMPMVQHTNVFD